MIPEIQLAFRLTWEPSGVVAVFFDQVTREDLIGARKAIDGNARRARLRYCIVDYRAARGFGIRPSDFDDIAQHDLGGSLNGKRLVCGVISPDEAVRQAVDRYKETLAAPYPMEVFPSLEQTREWIELQLKYMGLNGA